jgi:predicted TIM-barrel fold metal-dependent hydrolase
MIDAYAHLDMSVPNPLAELELSMDAAGVDRALVIETWNGDNRECLRKLIAASSDRFRIALCFRPDDEEPTAGLLSRAMVRALRVKTADVRRLGSLAADLRSTGKWLLPHAEDGVGALTEELLQIVALYPGLLIYLPHMGWPRQGRNDDRDWRESIGRLSKIPELVVGVSALAHFSRASFPHDDLKPFCGELRATFGPESLVAASDYPLFEKSRYPDYIRLACSWIPSDTKGVHRFESSLFGGSLARQEG